MVYGPLQNGATVLMYEGAPNCPATGPLLEDHRRPQGDGLLYRAYGDPRVHQAGATSMCEKHSLASLRLLGTVGEPINPEAWMWYHEKIGKEPLPDRGYVVADRDGRRS